LLEDLEAELGAAGIAALDDPRVMLRPPQAPKGPYRTIEVFTGERRTGKSHAARELFVRLMPRAERVRIMVATDDDPPVTVFGGESGLLEWTPPWIRCEYQKGLFAGTITYGDRTIVCCSVKGGGKVGPGWGLTWADDPAAWVKAAGKALAKQAWIDMLKSNSARPGVTVVATTGAGVDFIWGLLHEAGLGPDAVRVHDLGSVENNAGNLAPNYIRHTVPGLRASGDWDEDPGASGAFADVDWPSRRARAAPRLVRITVFADPNKSSHKRSCEVGVVATGIDARGNVWGLEDRSAVLGPDEIVVDGEARPGWPSVVHQLAEDLAEEFPGVPIRLGVEDNATGPNGAALLRQEGKLRASLAGKDPICRFEVFSETARPNEPKTRRAAEVVRAAKNGQVYMLGGLGVLEGQLSNLSDHGSGNDRADAFVWAARDVAGWGDGKGEKKAMEKQLTAEEAAAQCRIAAEFTARVAGRADTAPREVAPGILEPMKVEGAPPGDARHPGPSPWAAGRAPTWRSRRAL
jgi:hypothetical protein